jgi:hypothetical protein
VSPVLGEGSLGPQGPRCACTHLDADYCLEQEPAERKAWEPQKFNESTATAKVFCDCPNGPAGGNAYCYGCKAPVARENHPSIYSSTLPPWPTLEEIRKAVRDELRRAGVV